MMTWYREAAPIRQKLFVTFFVMTALVATGALGATLATSIVGPVVGIGVAVVMAAVAAIAGAWFRATIADPYVTTVVRMEALAAGDLSSSIQFTDYADCVGRMTKAMFTFRDTAVAQRDNGVEQKAVVDMVSAHLEELAAGDLMTAIEEDFPPEYAALKTNFNAALDSLRALITSVSDGAATIRTGSSEIAQASEDLARRTEANAASLEETAAAVTRMDGRLKATAVAAQSTVGRADQAIETVGSGRAVAAEAVQSMGRVSESAKGIDSVIEGLDKIAFQTRVLAMNAAVEAGRAGDAGRGFAVVADLVSALAMRAEEEAKRARDQLTATQSEIVIAVKAVQRVDGALAGISGDVGQVHELLATIATDNQAQSAAITQISEAVRAMDESTQQNAAMVEETSAAARNLSGEVGALTEAAERFRISGTGGRSKVRRLFGNGDFSPNAAGAARPLPAAAVHALLR
ncbi:Methyl-accepting chemotaxis sensory transducer [Sphingomonas aurantiaca]|uniref:Methyl-accepting chemotaxis sensory transducer n=2 Tax=Sphingomonas aurantiaca TaxID=185949 RepID=A0A5E7ZBG8_9SPHN|nr:methyl-accepting chemotaxis protein [Sphingomonas aurantiaca]VVT16112.1 Methyl-accepting chemotaxis sensory transducer [Sphingomonas aurantiaca]